MSAPLEQQTRLNDVEVPDWVNALAGGVPVTPVWRNEEGGLTFRFGDGERFLKVQRPTLDWDPDAERVRLDWVREFVAAPRVLDHGVRGELHWALTEGVPGLSAVDAEWRARPEEAIPALGRGLRRFHDAVPVDACPFSWSVADRVARESLDPVLLDHIPALDVVVCHGDACNPNFLLGADGEVCGYVDLGRLGVADRWADLAPALMSLGWNYGPGWEPTFLDAYGIEPDAAKQAYYTALWNAED